MSATKCEAFIMELKDNLHQEQLVGKGQLAGVPTLTILG